MVAADTTPPTVNIGISQPVTAGQPFTVSWSADDSGDGLASWEVKANPPNTSSWSYASITVG